MWTERGRDLSEEGHGLAVEGCGLMAGVEAEEEGGEEGRSL